LAARCRAGCASPGRSARRRSRASTATPAGAWSGWPRSWARRWACRRPASPGPRAAGCARARRPVAWGLSVQAPCGRPARVAKNLPNGVGHVTGQPPRGHALPKLSFSLSDMGAGHAASSCRRTLASSASCPASCAVVRPGTRSAAALLHAGGGDVRAGRPMPLRPNPIPRRRARCATWWRCAARRWPRRRSPGCCASWAATARTRPCSRPPSSLTAASSRTTGPSAGAPGGRMPLAAGQGAARLCGHVSARRGGGHARLRSAPGQALARASTWWASADTRAAGGGRLWPADMGACGGCTWPPLLHGAARGCSANTCMDSLAAGPSAS